MARFLVVVWDDLTGVEVLRRTVECDPGRHVIFEIPREDDLDLVLVIPLEALLRGRSAAKGVLRGQVETEDEDLIPSGDLFRVSVGRVVH